MSYSSILKPNRPPNHNLNASVTSVYIARSFAVCHSLWQQHEHTHT